MQTLIALLVAAAAACALARPPGPTVAPAPLHRQAPLRVRAPPGPLPPIDGLGEYLLPRMLLPHYVGYDDSPLLSDNDWLSKEIDRINQMEEDEELLNPSEADLMRWYSQDLYLQNLLESPTSLQGPLYAPESIPSSIESMVAPKPLPIISRQQLEEKRRPPEFRSRPSSVERKKFALTPIDEEYYQPISKQHKETIAQAAVKGLRARGEPLAAMLLEPPRQIRQNPIPGKQKHLLETDLGKMKSGLSNGGGGEDSEGSLNQQQHVDPSYDPANAIYVVALLAAIGAALTLGIVGIASGCYTLSKKAKAAADVDYPAYGVTGPSVDTSGDRKLAHSAHMYHYQHQKQQIIAMERNGMEQRAGSVSDPESEEENEEGDYTVYECPGFATTGDMEVKNPLFSEEPTPVTPGKCEVVKQQPKD